MTKIERYAPLVGGIALALPTLIARYLPMTDLPLHEGVVGVLRHFGDRSYFPDGLYQLNLGHPNQLFHIAAWLLSYVVSTSMACKLVVAAAQILIFVGGARLCDHLGRTRWAVLLLAPLALGFTFYWGLVANLLGFAALLFTLPALDRASEKPSLRGVGITCAVFVLLYFAHETVLISAALMLGLFASLQPLGVRATSLRLLPVALAAIGTFVHKAWAARLFPPAHDIPPAIFMTLRDRLKLLPNALFGSHDVEAQLMLLGISLLVLGLLLRGRWFERTPSGDPIPTPSGSRFERLRARLWTWRFEIAGLAHLVGYLVAPFAWNGATLVHERFLGPAWALLVLVAGPRVAASAPRILKIVAPMLPAGILLLSWPQFADADATYRRLDTAIAKIPKNAAVAQAIVDRPAVRTRVFSAGTGPARIIAERGGRIGLHLMISPISPALVNPQWRWDDFERRVMVPGSMALLVPHDLERWEWVVVMSRDPAMRRRAKVALADDADVAAEDGEVILFHSKHPPIPLLSPDVPPPMDSRQTTILDRVLVLEREERRSGVPVLPP